MSGAVGVTIQEITARCAQLERDLRKSKRREEKLTALQFRLKEDARQMGADPRLARFAWSSWCHAPSIVTVCHRSLALDDKMVGVIVYSCRLGLVHCTRDTVLLVYFTVWVNVPLCNYSTKSVSIALCNVSCSKKPCLLSLFTHRALSAVYLITAASTVVSYGLSHNLIVGTVLLISCGVCGRWSTSWTL